MNPFLIILSIIGGIVMLGILYLILDSYLNERAEKRHYKKEFEHFDYVARNISGCQHWLNSEEHKPFKDFFVFMVEEMYNNHNLKSEAVRRKVNEIISQYKNNRGSNNL